MKTKTKINLLKTIGLITRVTPIGIVFAFNYNEWITNSNGTSLTIGAILSMFMIAVTSLGKTEMISGNKGKIMLWVVMFCLNSIISDAFYIYSSYLAGDLVYSTFINGKIKYLTDLNKEETISKIRAEALSKELKEDKALEDKTTFGRV